MIKKNNRALITALGRKVNKPRLGLRVAKMPLSRTEKCIITTIFWAAGTGKQIDNLNPAMLGFNFGAMYHPEGHKNMPKSSLKMMRSYMKKYNIKDWTDEG